jgi:copper chaperone CopZ
VLALALAACGSAPEASAARSAAADAGDKAADVARVDFTVAGMDCAGCVLGTRTALRRLDGVRDAGAGFESIEASPAWALYDPERVTPERMIEAIGTLGYTASVVEER